MVFGVQEETEGETMSVCPKCGAEQISDATCSAIEFSCGSSKFRTEPDTELFETHTCLRRQLAAARAELAQWKGRAIEQQTIIEQLGESRDATRAELAEAKKVIERLCSAIDAGPSSAGCHIQFEGADVVAVSPEDLDDLHAAAEAAREEAKETNR